MAVYVDDVFIPFGRMIMCHMAADSASELVKMADKIGVQRKWLQYPGTDKEHFDVSKEKRKLAIRYGAVPVTARWLCSRKWGQPIAEQETD
jgi:hypothetical protein